MNKSKWKVEESQNQFGHYTECPKCGGTLFSRRYHPANDDAHFERKIKEFLSVHCLSCLYKIGEERTKDSNQ
jgi:C4-type Zn-finger protein